MDPVVCKGLTDLELAHVRHFVETTEPQMQRQTSVRDKVALAHASNITRLFGEYPGAGSGGPPANRFARCHLRSSGNGSTAQYTATLWPFVEALFGSTAKLSKMQPITSLTPEPGEAPQGWHHDLEKSAALEPDTDDWGRLWQHMNLLCCTSPNGYFISLLPGSHRYVNCSATQLQGLDPRTHGLTELVLKLPFGVGICHGPLTVHRGLVQPDECVRCYAIVSSKDDTAFKACTLPRDETYRDVPDDDWTQFARLIRLGPGHTMDASFLLRGRKRERERESGRAVGQSAKTDHPAT